jgi:hypothetical protein
MEVITVECVVDIVWIFACMDCTTLFLDGHWDKEVPRWNFHQCIIIMENVIEAECDITLQDGYLLG